MEIPAEFSTLTLYPSALADVAEARRDYMDESGGRYVHVIADGALGRSGDIAKAIACGADAVMVGDSEEADGAARELGCGFVLVDPLPTWERPDGLLRGLREYGLDI